MSAFDPLSEAIIAASKRANGDYLCSAPYLRDEYWQADITVHETRALVATIYGETEGYVRSLAARMLNMLNPVLRDE